MPADRPSCMYCGGPPVRDSEEKAIRCPRCAVFMDKVDVDALMLDVCKTCGATWYDRGELATRLKKQDAPTTAPTRAPSPGLDVKYLPCPKCRRPMLRRAFGRSSGVILDVCGPHGAFVDAG